MSAANSRMPPGLSIPISAATKGLPVGLALDGRPGGDEDILAVGQAVEAASRESTS